MKRRIFNYLSHTLFISWIIIVVHMNFVSAADIETAPATRIFLAQSSTITPPQPVQPTVAPSLVPVPPATGTPTVPPVLPGTSPDFPLVLDDEGDPIFGCGGRGEACCPPGIIFNANGTCLDEEDSPHKYDKNGNVIIGGYTLPGTRGISCFCEPKETYFDQIGNQLQIYKGMIIGSSSDALCNRYFAQANYTRIVDPGFNINSNRKLTPEIAAHLRQELRACHTCVTQNGFYTSLGCIPFEINLLLKGLILIGLFASGLLALFCIIYSAIRIQLSRGDSAKVSKAQESVKSCLLGLVLIIFSAFIINVFGTGLLGFSIVEPLQQALQQVPDVECTRECVYSEQHGTSTSCYKGACPASRPDCGVPGDVNKGCVFAGVCGNSGEVDCPKLTPLPSPIPTPPPVTNTPTPGPGTPTVPPTTPTTNPTFGPVPGGPTLVTETMLRDAISFHNNLWSKCSGSIHYSKNRNCVDDVDVNVMGREAGKAMIKQEMIGMLNYGEDDFQCVGYMKGMLSVYTGKKFVEWTSGGTAAALPEPLELTFSDDPVGKKVRYVFTFINKNVGPPLPGDFVKFRDGKAGHVGLVFEVVNNMEFRVQQANYSCAGCIDTFTFSRDIKEITGYYRLTNIIQP